MALMLSNVIPTNPIHAKLLALRSGMNARFFEREQAIDLLLVGLLARKHVLFLGPPGSGKSDMARTVCECIIPDDGSESKFYERQMTKGTTEDDLYGTPTLEGIKAGTNARCTEGTLLDARIAMLSEIWKSNDAVLNSLLYPLNERKYRNGRTMLDLPLEMLVGDSNELPDPEANLGALWDRFLLRDYVGYIKDPAAFAALWDMDEPAPVPTIALSELKAAQAQAAQVDLSRVKPLVETLKQTLESKNIVISTRRWMQVRTIIRAYAWLSGRTVAEAEDLEILPAALWEQKDQIAQIRALILGIANPLDNAALNLRDQALEAYTTAMQTIADRDNEQDPPKKAALQVKVPQVGTNSIATMQQITEQLQKLGQQAIAGGKNPDRIQATLNDVIGWNTEVAKKCLGIRI